MKQLWLGTGLRVPKAGPRGLLTNVAGALIAEDAVSAVINQDVGRKIGSSAKRF